MKKHVAKLEMLAKIQLLPKLLTTEPDYDMTTPRRENKWHDYFRTLFFHFKINRFIMTKSIFRSAFLTILVLSSCAGLSQQRSKTVSSIFIEFAYEGIPEGDEIQKMMFGNSRLSVYLDKNFMIVRKWGANAPDKSMAAIKVAIIKDYTTGKAYTCMAFGDNKLKTLEEDDPDLNQLVAGSWADPAYSLTQIADENATIQSFTCQKWHLFQEEMVSPHLYLTTDIQPAEDIKNGPMFVYRDGKYLGVCLGNDIEFGEYKKMLRAQKIEFNLTQNIAEELNNYRETTSDEANKVLKEWMGW